jgi:hypothetical protein
MDQLARDILFFSPALNGSGFFSCVWFEASLGAGSKEMPKNWGRFAVTGRVAGLGGG